MQSKSHNNNNGLLKKIKVFFMETDIRVLTFSPSIAILVIIFTWALISGKILRLEDPFPYTSLILGVSLVFLSLIGVIQIIRREVPGPGVFARPIRGTFAIISGVFFLLIFGVGGLVAIYIGFQNLLTK